MKMATEDYVNKVTCGDCLELMKDLDDNSIDTIITDPPYALEFMGKDWDKVLPSTEVWGECLRVCKPGATLLSFGGTRTFHRLACNIEDAGWVIKDTLCWLYGSGFPKATDISKQLDKKAGVNREIIGIKADFSMDGSNRNPKKHGDKTENVWGEYESGSWGQSVTKPSSDDAKLWSGYKSHGLKPAYEPIILAMKPNEGSYADNALKWGVSGLWIDGGRIELDGIEEHKTPAKSGLGKKGIYGKSTIECIEGKDFVRYTSKGRFPSNVLLDEEAAGLLDEQSGKRIMGGYPKKTKGINVECNPGIYGKYAPVEREERINTESGGASRFFYCAKASKSERNRGCEQLPTKQKYNKDGAWKSHEIFSEYRTDPVTGELKQHKQADNDFKNTHPTVKPLKLMEYLCKLTRTPTGGIVLDPFIGSGTTGLAAQHTGRDFIGFEINPEYCKIAEKRLAQSQLRDYFKESLVSGGKGEDGD